MQKLRCHNRSIRVQTQVRMTVIFNNLAKNDGFKIVFFDDLMILEWLPSTSPTGTPRRKPLKLQPNICTECPHPAENAAAIANATFRADGAGGATSGSGCLLQR